MTPSGKLEKAFEQLEEERILYTTGWEVDRETMTILDEAIASFRAEMKWKRNCPAMKQIIEAGRHK